ncbi:MAG: SGNH/GDSL hydrolase family protein, partial [Bacillota bacterium]|nr:SGNH/GDSL hydrolase family protein [Bacillota bacterium]
MNIKDYYNFVVYGDSISKGVVYDDTLKRYVLLKENFASLVGNKLKCVIYNMGKFGNNIVRGQQRIESEVIKKNPDFVLIEFGGNDCDLDWEAVARDPKGNHVPKTELPVFEKTLENIIRYFKKLNIIPVLMTLPPLDSERYFKWVCKNDPAAEEAVLSFLGDTKRIFTWQEQYSVKIEETAEKYGTAIIDVREAFLR